MNPALIHGALHAARWVFQRWNKSNSQSGFQVSWYAVAPTEVRAFLEHHEEAMLGSVFLAGLLEQGQETLIPEAALQLARMQAKHARKLVFVVVEG